MRQIKSWGNVKKYVQVGQGQVGIDQNDITAGLGQAKGKVGGNIGLADSTFAGNQADHPGPCSRSLGQLTQLVSLVEIVQVTINHSAPGECEWPNPGKKLRQYRRGHPVRR